MWAKLKFRVCIGLTRLGLMTPHLICLRCNREVAMENWERHEAAFHAATNSSS